MWDYKILYLFLSQGGKKRVVLLFDYFEYLDLGQHAYSTKLLIEYFNFHLHV